MKFNDIKYNFDNYNLIKDNDFYYTGKLGRKNKKNTISFINSEKYVHLIDDKISFVITKEDVVDKLPKNIGIITTENPKEFFYKIHEHLFESDLMREKVQRNISKSAIISNTAVLYENIQIGENTIIEDNVVIKDNVIIGNNCTIRSNSVIGTEGFEVCKINGKNKIISHAGKVIIHDDVEISSNCCINKGLFTDQDTIIHSGVMTDNLVNINHNVQIGIDTKICANVVISGNVSIGNNVWIGPGVIVSNDIKIEDNSRLLIGAVITKDIKEGQSVSGNFAID